MTDLRAVCATLAAFVAHGCTTNTPNPDPHYVLGTAYQVGSVWFYPRASEDLDETGLAAIAKDGHARLTTDGEVFDQTALAAAHPTLQLPAIARLTNLENGLQVTVRVNDRGSGDPHRLVEITKRTAVLLGVMTTPSPEVRLQVLPNESRAAADALPGAPRLAMAAAPRETVEVAELPPPAGVAQRQESRAITRAAALGYGRASRGDRGRAAAAPAGGGRPDDAPTGPVDGAPRYLRRASIRRRAAGENERGAGPRSCLSARDGRRGSGLRSAR